MNKFR